MDTNLNVASAPKDSTFQVRINSEIKRAVEDIYAKTGMTLTDAIRGLCDYDGVDLLNANDESAGQAVLHFHIHIIPRKKHDDLGESGE